MITKIYIDNFRCLTNFELKPEAMNLFLGENGSGKTAVFDAVSGVAGIVLDQTKIRQVFPESSTTRWENRREQKIELELTGMDGLFCYRIVIAHPEDRPNPIIATEAVDFEGRRLYEFSAGHVSLPGDDSAPGAGFSFNPELSFLGLLEERPEHQHLRSFKDALREVWRFAVEPTKMAADSARFADIMRASDPGARNLPSIDDGVRELQGL